MPKVKEIRDHFEERIPAYMKYDFDNVGLLVGTAEREVNRVLVALDITGEVIAEARSFGAELVMSHHPLFFELKSVTDEDSRGRRVVELLSNKMSAICLHTNLDAAEGGVNDALLEKLGAAPLGLLSSHGAHPDGRPYGIGRVGKLAAPISLAEFLKVTKGALNSNGLRYHDAGREVFKIACCGGSGGDFVEIAAGTCDTYVTSDIKYDRFLAAKELGINLIDADHFCTENVVVPVIADFLKEAFPALEVKISESLKQTANFF